VLEESSSEGHKLLDGRVTVNARLSELTVHEPCFVREISNAIVDLFNEPGYLMYSPPAYLTYSHEGPWMRYSPMGDWKFIGAEKIDYRAFPKEDEPRPGAHRCSILYQYENGQTHSVADKEMLVKPFITYLDENGTQMRQNFENDKELDEFVSYDATIGLYVYDAPSGQKYRLSSIDDSVAFYEEVNKRQHKLYNGLLHSINGPAFICEKPSRNEEYYIYGLKIEKGDIFPGEFLSKNKKYLQRLEEFVLSTKIDVELLDLAHSLDSIDSLEESIAGGYFQFQEGDVKIDIMNLEPIAESGSTGIAVGLAALGIAAATAFATKGRRSKREKLAAAKQLVAAEINK